MRYFSNKCSLICSRTPSNTHRRTRRYASGHERQTDESKLPSRIKAPAFLMVTRHTCSKSSSGEKSKEYAASVWVWLYARRSWIDTTERLRPQMGPRAEQLFDSHCLWAKRLRSSMKCRKEQRCINILGESLRHLVV